MRCTPDTPGEQRNSRFKIDAPIDTLEQFRVALLIESDRTAATRK